MLSKEAVNLKNRTLTFATIGIVCIVIVVALLVMISHFNQPISKSGSPPPQLIKVDTDKSIGSTSPQMAFSKSVQLLPCRGAPANSLTTTWLDADSTFGVVYLKADCSNYSADPRPVIAILPFGRLSSGKWAVFGGEITPEYPASGSQPPTVVPSWLPLPQAQYLGGKMPVANSVPSGRLDAFIAKDHSFITGTFAKAAIRLPDAQDIEIQGRHGWLEQQNDFVIVTVMLQGNTTFFFAGNAPADQIEALAETTLLHIDQL